MVNGDLAAPTPRRHFSVSHFPRPFTAKLTGEVKKLEQPSGTDSFIWRDCAEVGGPASQPSADGLDIIVHAWAQRTRFIKHE